MIPKRNLITRKNSLIKILKYLYRVGIDVCMRVCGCRGVVDQGCGKLGEGTL